MKIHLSLKAFDDARSFLLFGAPRQTNIDPAPTAQNALREP
jgi:hypothetical protein